MEKLDPTVLVALVSLIGFVISGGFAVLTALITNRKEKTSAAEEATDLAIEKLIEEKEDVLMARITLRDEQLARAALTIVDLEADIARLKKKYGETP